MQTALSTLQLQPVSRFNSLPSRLNDSYRHPIEVEAVEVEEDIITPQFTKRLYSCSFSYGLHLQR